MAWFALSHEIKWGVFNVHSKYGTVNCWLSIESQLSQLLIAATVFVGFGGREP